MKDYVFIPKKKDQNVINSLNTLIYDYLIKMKYEKTAKAFVNEAFIEEKFINDSTPTLFQWYLAFHEISNIRCGISSNSTDLARIEGIMLKLENEKKRYQHMGRMDTLNYYDTQKDQSDMFKSPNINYKPHFYSEQSPIIDTRKPLPVRNPSSEQNYNNKVQYSESSLIKGRKKIDYPQYGSPISNSPKFFEQAQDFVLKNVNTFKISDFNVINSVLSSEHNILFNVYDNKTIGSFNCLTLKNECIVETNGKQITQIRIKDTVDFVWIVASFDSNDLMVIRYIINEIKFEMAGYLRGHVDRILCFDVSDFIYSIDVKGYFRKWNFKGFCEKEDFFNGQISKLYAFTDNCLIISDGTRTYLYDHAMNMDMSEISKGKLVNIKKQNNLFLLIFTDKVILYDKGLNKLKILLVPDNNIKSAVLMDSDIIIGSSKTLWYESQGRLNKCTVLDQSDLISIESINNYKPGHVLVLSQNGECKIMSKCYNF